MLTKLTGKREKFTRALFEGLSQTEAYRRAFNTENMANTTITKRACELAKDERVKAMLEGLKAPIVEKLREKYEYSLQHAMAEAQEAFQVGKKTNSGNAMVAAVVLRAKLNGLMIERKEVTITEVQKLDDDALDRLIALKAVEAGVAMAEQGATRH